MRRFWGLILTALLILAGCSGGGDNDNSPAPSGQTPDPIEIQSIFIPEPEENTFLPAGRTLTLEAKGIFTDGTTQDITNQVEWSSSDTTVATVDNGVVITEGRGTAEIKITHGSLPADTLTITVNEAVVDYLQIAPSPINIPAGTSVELTVTAFYSDGNDADVTAEAAISSEDSNIVIEGSSVTAEGPAQIVVSYMGLEETVDVTVTDAILEALTITSGNVEIHPHLTFQMEATETYSDESIQPLTPSFTWVSEDTTIVTVDGNGLLTAVNPGETLVYVEKGGILSEPVPVHVYNSTVTAMRVQPVNAYNPLDFDFPYTVSCAFEYLDKDGFLTTDRLEITELAEWSSTNPAVAVVDNTVGNKGKVHTGSVMGEAILTATWEDESDSTTVYVQPLDYELGMNRDHIRVPGYSPDENTDWRQYPLPEICDGSWCRERSTANAAEDEFMYRQYRIRVYPTSAPITITNLWQSNGARYDNLTDGRIIHPGEEVIFTLFTDVPTPGEGQVFYEWTFDILEDDGTQLDPFGPEFHMSVFLQSE